MSDTVTIPADVAREIGRRLRDFDPSSAEVADWADILDPKPPRTLREQVADAMLVRFGITGETRDVFMPHAEVALITARDAVAALPGSYGDPNATLIRRGTVLDLLDGGTR